ncbi:hypothetical protein PA598K_02844 [Paenibacillus sp. 598K]|uniref:DUF6789 family protein n=1 Tax=Paenibacillus sp. 598K TaxID=1117987 RepID=UPI000FFA7F43|nr:DUF6789 family protein [Paenibacillus sp. 598K]GBF74496.1 hypothetical protein PA598K_02844 [Paenibacillus sp. 598K]
MTDDWRRSLLRGTTAGLLSGVALGLLLKAIEQWSGSKVYTLLLNVDFIPWLPEALPEWLEFAMHLVVAVPLGWACAYLAVRYGRPLRFGAATGLAAAVLTWAPLTALSDRTPDTADIGALRWWLAAHLIYGLVLGLALRRLMSRREVRR